MERISNGRVCGEHFSAADGYLNAIWVFPGGAGRLQLSDMVCGEFCKRNNNRK